MNQSSSIPGYPYGTSVLSRSPVSLDDFELLKKTVLFGEDDAKHLRLSADVLKDQTDVVLDVWYGFVGGTPHLLHYFTNKQDGQANVDYLGAVRKRFSQ